MIRADRSEGPRHVARVIAFILLLVLALAALLPSRLLPSRHDVSVGEPAPRTIKSSQDKAFPSETLLKEAQKKATASLAPIQVYDPTVAARQAKKLDTLDWAASLARSGQAGTPRNDGLLKQIEELQLSPEVQQGILALSPESWQAAVAESKRLLLQAFDSPIAADQLSTVRQLIPQRIGAQVSPALKPTVTELVQSLIVPNMLIDEKATQQARAAAADRVGPQDVTLKKGETIVREGAVVSELDIEKLQAAGVLGARMNWHDMAGAALLALAVAVVLGLYILRIESKQPTTPKQLLLLGVIIIGTVVAAKLIIPGRELYAFLFPIAAAPVLVAVLLDAQLAIITAAVLSLLVAYIGSISPDSQGLAQVSALAILQRTTVYMLSSVASVLFVGRGERLNRFAIAGIAVTLVLVAVNLAFWLFSPSHELSRLGWFSAVSLGNGSLAAVLSVGIFLLMGYIFGVPTSFHLMELSQPNQPLLRRLLTEAPGTYHHSIIVGNLGERAADMIGADSLLVRVGCYYHDIGKLRRPAYFVENQMAGVNVHDSLDPRQSASIVTEHIRDGLELAERYKLPHKLRAFIPEHHGARLASYFYRRAKEQGLEVNPDDFRYPGPKPQSKETAIVMLADSVEATARAKDDHSPEQLDATVDAVIAERIGERQLDECDLTLRDVEIVRRAFKDVLRGIYHPRLEYPAPVAGERAATAGDERAQISKDDRVARTAHPAFRVLPGGKKRPDN